MTQTILRKEYSRGRLDHKDLAKDALVQFSKWFRQAAARKLPMPNAMTLATATRKGKPLARVVLLKGLDSRGLVFYTNYRSPKARELRENPQACAVFYWAELERQVCISGRVRKISRRESERYFHSRPRNSQIAAWASNPQSGKIASRGALEKKFEFFRKKFENRPVPLPPYWGGYRVRPGRFEFWQGRGSRLNDRFLYEKQKGKWKITRLLP